MNLKDVADRVAIVNPSTRGLQTTTKPVRFFYEEALTDGVWSQIVLIPQEGITSISYDLHTLGTATVQATVYPEESIIAETAVWRDIPDNVRINTSVTAIRAKSEGATGNFIVRAQ
jgi:hypothetical protein